MKNGRTNTSLLSFQEHCGECSQTQPEKSTGYQRAESYTSLCKTFVALIAGQRCKAIILFIEV